MVEEGDEVKPLTAAKKLLKAIKEVLPYIEPMNKVEMKDVAHLHKAIRRFDKVINKK